MTYVFPVCPMFTTADAATIAVREALMERPASELILRADPDVLATVRERFSNAGWQVDVALDVTTMPTGIRITSPKENE
jgi:hypothetical protein